jgi:hypothetical protein
MFALLLSPNPNPSPSPFPLLFFMLCVLSSSGCGPEPLPGFANPPPEDASTDDTDSGVDSEVP